MGTKAKQPYFTPEELPDNKYYLFGQDGGKMLAEKNEVPFLGEGVWRRWFRGGMGNRFSGLVPQWFDLLDAKSGTGAGGFDHLKRDQFRAAGRLI